MAVARRKPPYRTRLTGQLAITMRGRRPNRAAAPPVSRDALLARLVEGGVDRDDGGLECHKLRRGGVVDDAIDDLVVVVAQHVTDATYVAQAISGCDASSASGSRRVASEMISMPRWTPCFSSQSFENASNDLPFIATSMFSMERRIASTAGRDSRRRGIRICGSRLLRCRAASADEGCPASSREHRAKAARRGAP